ncbi:hypothetical protein Tco_0496131 [Tanacetum coccineum]
MHTGVIRCGNTKSTGSGDLHEQERRSFGFSGEGCSVSLQDKASKFMLQVGQGLVEVVLDMARRFNKDAIMSLSSAVIAAMNSLKTIRQAYYEVEAQNQQRLQQTIITLRTYRTMANMIRVQIFRYVLLLQHGAAIRGLSFRGCVVQPAWVSGFSCTVGDLDGYISGSDVDVMIDIRQVRAGPELLDALGETNEICPRSPTNPNPNGFIAALTQPCTQIALLLAMFVAFLPLPITAIHCRLKTNPSGDFVIIYRSARSITRNLRNTFPRMSNHRFELQPLATRRDLEVVFFTSPCQSSP